MVDQAGVLRMIKGKSRSAVPSRRKEGRNPDNVRVIAVTSGKGGVGKTSIAANIAYLLSRAGYETLLLDADAGLANIDIMLGITPKYNLSHLLRGEKSLEDIVLTGPGNIRILPGASGVRDMADLSARERCVLLEEVESIGNGIDFIVIDTAAGISGNVMYFNMIAKEVIVVVTPEPTSLTDAYALIKLLYQEHGTKRFMLIVNMARDDNDARFVYRRLSNALDRFLHLSIAYMGHILYDDRVEEAVRRQQILMESFPSGKAAQCLSKIVKRLSDEEPAPYDRGAVKLFGRAVIDHEYHG